MGCQNAYKPDNAVIAYADLGAPDRAKERRRYRRDKRNFWMVRVVVWTFVLGTAYVLGVAHGNKAQTAPAQPTQRQGDVDKGMHRTVPPKGAVPLLWKS